MPTLISDHHFRFYVQGTQSAKDHTLFTTAKGSVGLFAVVERTSGYMASCFYFY